MSKHEFTRRGAIATCCAGAVGVLAACNEQVPPSPPGSGSGRSQTFALADLPVGSVLTAAVDSVDLVVSRPSEDEVIAFSNRCTHRGCGIQYQNTTLTCPCHGSVFDTTTGEPTVGPAKRALDRYAVEINGDTFTITL